MGGREFARALVVAGVMMLAACSGTDAPAVQDADPVVVEPSPPTVTLLASATQGLVGEPIRLDWTSSHADHCDAAGAWSGSRPLAGTEQLSIDAAGPAVYELTCTSSEGSATASATVTGLLAPTLTLVSSASRAVLGSEVMLSWNAEDATECEASGSEDWQGSRPRHSRVAPSSAAHEVPGCLLIRARPAPPDCGSIAISVLGCDAKVTRDAPRGADRNRPALSPRCHGGELRDFCGTVLVYALQC